MRTISYLSIWILTLLSFNQNSKAEAGKENYYDICWSKYYKPEVVQKDDYYDFEDEIDEDNVDPDYFPLDYFQSGGNYFNKLSNKATKKDNDRDSKYGDKVNERHVRDEDESGSGENEYAGHYETASESNAEENKTSHLKEGNETHHEETISDSWLWKLENTYITREGDLVEDVGNETTYFSNETSRFENETSHFENETSRFGDETNHFGNERNDENDDREKEEYDSEDETIVHEDEDEDDDDDADYDFDDGDNDVFIPSSLWCKEAEDFLHCRKSRYEDLHGSMHPYLKKDYKRVERSVNNVCGERELDDRLIGDLMSDYYRAWTRVFRMKPLLNRNRCLKLAIADLHEYCNPSSDALLQAFMKQNTKRWSPNESHGDIVKSLVRDSYCLVNLQYRYCFINHVKNRCGSEISNIALEEIYYDSTVNEDCKKDYDHMAIDDLIDDLDINLQQRENLLYTLSLPETLYG